MALMRWLVAVALLTLSKGVVVTPYSTCSSDQTCFSKVVGNFSNFRITKKKFNL